MSTSIMPLIMSFYEDSCSKEIKKYSCKIKKNFEQMLPFIKKQAIGHD